MTKRERCSYPALVYVYVGPTWEAYTRIVPIASLFKCDKNSSATAQPYVCFARKRTINILAVSRMRPLRVATGVQRWNFPGTSRVFTHKPPALTSQISAFRLILGNCQYSSTVITQNMKNIRNDNKHFAFTSRSNASCTFMPVIHLFLHTTKQYRFVSHLALDFFCQQ